MSLWYISGQLFCDFSSRHYPSSFTSRDEDSIAVLRNGTGQQEKEDKLDHSLGTSAVEQESQVKS